MPFVIQNSSCDPFVNLALEETLCSYAAEKGETVMFLWQNRLCCVIGINQNPWLECDVEAMDKAGALLVRRRTGGGAVCHDPGNLNFSFCAPKGSFDAQKGNAIVLSALRTLGLNAEASGRNDICVSGKKISGSAFRHSGDFSLHHGTLLVNSELSLFPKFLTPDSQKLNAKGVRSVEARVANLSHFAPDVTVEVLRKALEAAFTEKMGAVETLSPDGFDVSALSEFYASHGFRYGRTPAFSENLSFRLPGAGINVGLTVEKGIVTDCHVWTDSLDTSLPGKLSATLIGRPYSPDLVRSSAEILVGRETP